MEDIKARIYECGKELFSSQGYKDTNVSDITKKAGIAVGTFYNYYSSKDKLFMQIFLDENVKLKKNIMQSLDMKGDPLKIVNEMLLLNFKGINSDPIMKEWYNRDVFNKIERNYRRENGIENVDFMYDSFIEVVRKWQDEGRMRSDIDSGMIMAIFSAIINIDTHKEEVGLQYFPEVQNHLAEFVMKGLTDRPK
jgi:AcrR family transcriptional regulator